MYKNIKRHLFGWAQLTKAFPTEDQNKATYCSLKPFECIVTVSLRISHENSVKCTTFCFVETTRKSVNPKR